MNFFKTQDDIAKHFHVGRHTVGEWVRRSGFPTKSQKGWNAKKVDGWLRENNLGPHRANGTTTVETNGDGISLRAAQIKKCIESGERDRVSRELQEIQLLQARGEILDAATFFERDKQIAAAVTTILGQIPDSVDRALGDSIPLNVRQRATADVARIIRDSLSAIQQTILET